MESSLFYTTTKQTENLTPIGKLLLTQLNLSCVDCGIKTGQERRKHLKSGRTRAKKGHMTTPINGQNSKRSECIPNQVHTVFGWGLKFIDLICVS